MSRCVTSLVVDIYGYFLRFTKQSFGYILDDLNRFIEKGLNQSYIANKHLWVGP